MDIKLWFARYCSDGLTKPEVLRRHEMDVTRINALEEMRCIELNAGDLAELLASRFALKSSTMTRKQCWQLLNLLEKFMEEHQYIGPLGMDQRKLGDPDRRG